MGILTSVGTRRRLLASSLVGAFIAGGIATSASAADLTAPVVAAPPVLTSDWASTITHTEQFEAGIAVNPDNPRDHNNFGQEFTDKPNEPEFDQFLLTIARPVDETKAYDIGFNFQSLFGSDARYDPTLGLFAYSLRGREQFIFTQANVVVHSPFLTAGGIDTKIGLFPGAMGYETTDPSTRPFYTLSYITNFLLAFEHVGALATWHVNPTIDIYAGIDTGNETTFGRGDNNNAAAGYFGFGLNNLLDNKLTVLAISRIGPEDPIKTTPGADHLLRFWNDVTLTYKATDKWTFVGEGNYFRDEGIVTANGQQATAYGFDGYASYAWNDQVTFNVRGEIYRDDTGLITTGYLTNTAFTSAIAGNPDFFSNAPPTTYGAITGGVTLKPAFLNNNPAGAKITIRPEVRYDASLNGTRPFDVQTKSGQFLFSTDLIVAF